ncbi:MAG: tetratricopeptide repeat protein [Hyphomicrobiaceae bacterium]
MRRLLSSFAVLSLMTVPALADDQADCKSNNYDLVVLSCTKLIDSGSLSPVDKASALGSRAWGYKGRGEYDKALADWQACEAETPNDAYCPAGLADLAYAQANYDEAVKQADLAIGKSPKYTWPMAVKGASLRLKGLYSQSIETLNQALKLDPRYTYALYQRGLSYSNNEDYEKAVSDFSKVLLIDNTYNDARSSRAYSHFAAGNLDKAIADIDKSIESNPSDHYSWALRGYMVVLQETGDAAKASADLEKAIALNAGVDWYYTYRAFAYIKAGKLDQAKADLDRVIAKYPKSIEDNTYLGMLKEKQGDTAGAIAAYRIALESAATGVDGRRAQEQALDRLAALDSQ